MEKFRRSSESQVAVGWTTGPREALTRRRYGTDRAGRGRGRAAARRAGRAGAWSSRAAGRGGRAARARAWRAEVAPSERARHERVRQTLPCRRPLFANRFFYQRAGAGPHPTNRTRPPPPPRAASLLIYVPYIKRVFRVPLWIFPAKRFTSGSGRTPVPSRNRHGFRATPAKSRDKKSILTDRHSDFAFCLSNDRDPERFQNLRFKFKSVRGIPGSK